MRNGKHLWALALALVIPLNAHATCGSDVSFADYYSLITGTTFGPSLRSSFWMVSTGNPALGAGNDNGAVADLSGPDSWIVPYGGGMIIQSGWAQRVYDGCCDAAGSVASQRMAYALSDVNGAGQMVYAAGCAHREPALGVQFSFDRPGNAPIALVPAPKPQIVSSTRVGTEAMVALAAPDFSTGFYGDGSVGCELTTVIPQYDVYKQQVARGTPPDNSPDVGPSWVLVSTVNTGTPFTYTTTCALVDCDVYLAFAPHYASNFSTGEPATGAPTRLGPRSTKIGAGQILATPPERKLDHARQAP